MPLPISGHVGDLSAADIRLEAWKLLNKQGITGTALAVRLGISPGYLGDFLAGRTPYPPGKLLKALKIEKRILFVRINGRE
jgi:transcriptional regulator with XRE-family HTH domain